MSSSAATKFQDHYAVLGIEPKADGEVIQRAFHELKAKIVDPDKLEAVHIAYEVLSDVSLRRAFDRIKGVNQNEGDPKFTGLEFFEGFGRDTVLRVAILCILYDRRRTHPYTPTLSMRALENIVAASNDELMVALWYLKQRNLVVNDDKSSLQITVDGLDFLEEKAPNASAVMPMIKPAFIDVAAVRAEPVHPVHVEAVQVEEVRGEPVLAEPPPPPPEPAAHHFKSPESVLRVLNRALSRG
jgi:hypothetical protein